MALAALHQLADPDHPTPIDPRLGPSSSWLLAAAMALLVSVGSAVLWPGDAPWFWDEPLEIGEALTANEDHQLAQHGLHGSFPFPYGALGVHINQFWLLFTHDPRVLVVLHALFCTIPTTIALLWLARTLRLSPWFAVAVLAAPHLWFESRRLWQPSFCIPLGAMAIAAHASFLRTRSGWSLVLAIACAMAPLFVHLQCLPLSLAILGHLAWRHRPALRRHWKPIVAVIAGFVTLHGTYILTACIMILAGCFSYIRTGHNSNTPLAQAWWGPVLGGRLFSGFEWGFGTSRLARAVDLASSAAMPLVWLGMALAIWKLATTLRRRQRPHPATAAVPKGTSESSESSARSTILLICLAGFFVHVVICAVFRLSPTTHYFFGTFGIYVVFAWLALDSLPHRALRALVTTLYGLSAAAITVAWIWHVHCHSWPRTLSPTLDDQIAVVRQLNRYADTWAYTDVPAYSDRPYVLLCLRRLLPPAPGEPRTYSGRLFIRYRQGPDGQPTDHIELVETPGQPPGAKLIPLVAESEQEVRTIDAVGKLGTPTSLLMPDARADGR